MSRSIVFKTFWNVEGCGGINIPPDTMTEPDQNCLTIREILTRFGVLPEMERNAALGGAYASEQEALAASGFAVGDKLEALELSASLAEQMATKADSLGAASGSSEEGPIPSPPQDDQSKSGRTSSTSAAQTEATEPEA